MSADELEEQVKMYERGIRKRRVVTTSEDNPNGMLITPEMGGKIVVSVLQKGKGHIAHVNAELSKREVEPPMELSKMKWKEVTALLRKDEYKRLVELELAWDINHWTRVTEIEPLSEEMAELFDYQADYFPDKQSRQTPL